jgi:hypothetical protein
VINIVTVVFDCNHAKKKYLVWIFLFKCRPFFEVHETEIKEMFGVADHDNNGHIGFKEFMVPPFLSFLNLPSIFVRLIENVVF